MEENKGKGLFYSSSLSQEIPFADEFTEIASGMIAITNSREDNSRFFWFRKEKKETVKWGGVPQKNIEKKENGEFMLNPRSSFEQWLEKTEATAEEWSESELEIIESLQGKILHLTTRKLDEGRKEKLQQELTKQVGIRTKELTNSNERLKHEVEERKRAEKRLYDGMEELESTNRELEHFAYVASHDLQEPLRVISSFTELLAKKYKGNLDDKANMYINFILDGSSRMKQLIMDLLEYSRLSKKDIPDVPVNLNVVYADVIQNLQLQIEETEAQVSVAELPTVFGNKVKFNQLLQNLIGNAIKYRRSGTSPIIKLGVEDIGEYWEFYVSDNGIGIPIKHATRIFIIFQRLHTKDEFSGTGIGLSLCQKIVEQQGGKIWLDENSKDGTTIRFTLKKRKK